MRLLSDNGGVFRKTTMWLSTVTLPIPINGNGYETCLFTDDDSEVLATHYSIVQATEFHINTARNLGLK